ncbi:hypothetical protein E2C01_046015 [Portunus trituberculatus]|uniref:Uncharacterized protein n=1 Tax=Portunus trituberculatus TaxID=210409 RepID=A0A5B7G4G5_PORTR|nr:hypothetical protein [Portunus trituberculatus]
MAATRVTPSHRTLTWTTSLLASTPSTSDQCWLRMSVLGRRQRHQSGGQNTKAQREPLQTTRNHQQEPAGTKICLSFLHPGILSDSCTLKHVIDDFTGPCSYILFLRWMLCLAVLSKAGSTSG